MEKKDLAPPIKSTITGKSANFSSDIDTEKTKTKKNRKKIANESALFKKKFRENPSVEQLYKIIQKYKLREQAYKTAIEIYLSRL